MRIMHCMHLVVRVRKKKMKNFMCFATLTTNIFWHQYFNLIIFPISLFETGIGKSVTCGFQREMMSKPRWYKCYRSLDEYITLGLSFVSLTTLLFV